eukprot:Opistho-2@56558
MTLSRAAVSYLEDLGIANDLRKSGGFHSVDAVDRRQWSNGAIIGCDATPGDASVVHGGLWRALMDALKRTSPLLNYVDIQPGIDLTRCEAADDDIAFSGEQARWRKFAQPLIAADGANSAVRRILLTNYTEHNVFSDVLLWTGCTPGAFSDSRSATSLLCPTGVSVFPTNSAVMVLRRIADDAHWSVACGPTTNIAVMNACASVDGFTSSLGSGIHLHLDNASCERDSGTDLIARSTSVTPSTLAEALSTLGIDNRLADMIRNADVGEPGVRQTPFGCLPIFQRKIKLPSYSYSACAVLVGDAAHPIAPLFSRPLSLALCDVQECVQKLSIMQSRLAQEWLSYYVSRSEVADRASAAATKACELLVRGSDLGSGNSVAQRFFSENPP